MTNSQSGPIPTPAATENYSGVASPEPSDAGTLQCSTWADLNVRTGGLNGTWLTDVPVQQGVPAQTNVTVSGTGVTRIGAPNQFKLQVSLSAGTVQLTGHVSDARNANTGPTLAPFTWSSRQRFVATVDENGLITLVGRGSTTIECHYPRSANLPFTNATPSATEFAYATVDLTVTG